jgi:pyruvate kinase
MTAISGHLTNRMKLEWHSKLDTDMVPAKNYRKTSIICTIGRFSFAALARPLTRPPSRRLLMHPAGPKTNSAEKINMLRKGTLPHASNAMIMLTRFS